MNLGCAPSAAEEASMRLFQSTSIFALAVATLTANGALAAPAPNTTPANVNVLNLLSPFLGLNGDAKQKNWGNKQIRDKPHDRT